MRMYLHNKETTQMLREVPIYTHFPSSTETHSRTSRRYQQPSFIDTLLPPLPRDFPSSSRQCVPPADYAILTNPNQSVKTPAQLKVATLCLLPRDHCPDPVLCVICQNGTRFYMNYQDRKLVMTIVRAPPTSSMRVREVSAIGSSLFVQCEDRLAVIYRQQDIHDRYVEKWCDYRGGLVGIRGVGMVNTGLYPYETRDDEDHSALVMVGLGELVQREMEPRALILGLRGVECLVRCPVYDEKRVLKQTDNLSLERLSNLWIRRMMLRRREEVKEAEFHQIDSILRGIYQNDRNRFVVSLNTAFARLLRPFIQSCLLSDQFAPKTLRSIADMVGSLLEVLETLPIIPTDDLRSVSTVDRYLYALELAIVRCLDIAQIGLEVGSI